VGALFSGHRAGLRAGARPAGRGVGCAVTARTRSTYESVALSVLVYEFPFTEKRETGAKISARLKRRRLGDYDEARIERLRRLKDDVQREIGKQSDSSYFVGPLEGEPRRRYVEMTDFDIARLTADLVKKYPEIPDEEIGWFVPFATFIYHML
jgi:hypothetical protein